MCFQGGRGVETTSVRASHVERVLASSLPFGGVVELAHLYASCSFIEAFFLCLKQRTRFAQYCLSPLQFAVLGLGVPFVTESLSLLPFFCHSLYLLLCRNSSVGPQVFFKKNCSVNRYHFVCSVKEMSSGCFNITILDPTPNSFR